MRRLISVLWFIPALAAAQARPATAALLHRVDSLAKAFVAAGGTPSVAIAITRGGNTIVMGAWGKSDIEQNVTATPLSVYEIGSATKQFTAAAVMQLVEQGKVKLDESIATYLPTLPAAWRAATVRQLLNHTSGIPNYTSVPAWPKRWGEEMTADSLISPTTNLPMDFAPGTQYRYDNQGYVLLGMIIERVTAKPWATDLMERFTIPLGLTSTRACDATAIIPHRARGYDTQNGAVINAPFFGFTQAFSAGSICSTVGDLARWNFALHTGKVVSDASYQLMITPSGAATAGRYGFGLMVDTVGGHTLIKHGGSIPGFATANGWVTGEALSVTVLANNLRGNPDQLWRQVMRAALGLPLAPPAVSRRTPPGTPQ